MEPLDGWTSGAPGAQMCVRAYWRRVSVVDVRVFRAYALGERLLGLINIIIITQDTDVCCARHGCYPKDLQAGLHHLWFEEVL